MRARIFAPIAATAVVFALLPAVNASATTPAFISSWDTTATISDPTSTADNQLRLPLVPGGTYDFTADWGDGTTSDVTSADDPDATHTYAAPNPSATVSITGTIEGFAFLDKGDRNKLTDISQWGQLRLGNTGGYFYGASSLSISAADSPDLSETTNMSYAFYGAAFFTDSIANWDVSAVTDMSFMFADAWLFNEDISGWDTSAVTSMRSMFMNANSFNQPIGTWNTSSVTDMSFMFFDAYQFDQSVGSWDVTHVADMKKMFSGSLSPISYDNLLTGWASQQVMTGLTLDIGSVANTSSSSLAKGVLTETRRWSINDGGGFVTPPSLPGRQRQTVITRLPIPLRLPKNGTRVILPVGTKTSAGMSVRVSVSGRNARKGKRLYRVFTTPGGTVAIRTFGRAARISIAWTAPATNQFEEFHRSRSYRISA